jgi:hypothetical protein
MQPLAIVSGYNNAIIPQIIIGEIRDAKGIVFQCTGTWAC